MDTKYKYETLQVLKRMNEIFHFDKTLFFSNDITSEDFPVIEIDNLAGKKEGYSYSYFCLQELPKYIDTDFCLVVQHDGFIINPEKWTDRFLEYDYIGAPWPDHYPNRVGNGGFSLRSRAFLQACLKIFADKPIAEHEDLLACVHHYHNFRDYGIRFAPVDLALDFSVEHIVPELIHMEPFGFHGHFTNLGKKALYENTQRLSL